MPDNPTTGRRIRFGRGLTAVAGITGANTVAQAVNFVAALVLARLYDPQAFGVFAFVQSVLSVISMMSTWKLDQAIPISKSNEDAGALMRLGLLVATLTAAASLPFVAAFNSWSGDEFRTTYSTAMWLLPPLILVVSAQALVAGALIRQERYKIIGARVALQSVVTAIAQLLAAPIGTGVALLMGDLLGRSVATAGLAKAIKPTWSARSSAPGVLRRFASFPTRIMPAALCDAASIQIPMVFAAVFFGPEDAGYLSLALRSLSLPVALVGTAVAQVLLGKMSDTNRGGDGQNYPRVRTAVRALSLMATALFVVTITLSPQLFSLVYGAEWRQAGEMAQAMALGVAVNLIWNPISSTYLVYGRFGAFLRLSVLRLIAGTVVGLAVVESTSSVYAMVFAVSATQAVIEGFGVIAAVRIARRAHGSAKEECPQEPEQGGSR